MKRLVFILILATGAYLGYGAYENHRRGFNSLPPMKPNEYPLSYDNGLRAIVTVPDRYLPAGEPRPPRLRRLSKLFPDRKFLGLAAEVPTWFEDTWSRCRLPTEQERSFGEDTSAEDWRKQMIGARLEFVCEIEADGELIPRGLIYSVPKN